jgi:hypothetical protein
MTVDPNDYRLADFKLLLPLRPDARALVIGAEEPLFLRHLAGELREVHAVGMEPDPPSAPQPTSGASSNATVRRLAQPEGLYDLVFSDSLEAARHLRPGGTLCQLASDTRDTRSSPADGLQPVGRWRAFPSWPDFRVLIPEHAAGWSATVRGLRLLPMRSWLGLLAQLHPAIAAWRLPGHGIALYRLEPEGTSSPTSLLESADAALVSAAGREPDSPEFDPMGWVPVSGRLGPGNPILAFRVDRSGDLRRLIKLARHPEADHLLLEAQQLQLIEQELGPELAMRVIRPTASARIDGRAALAYDYVPTSPFFGLRWRVQSRRRFCRAMTEWLATVARRSRRDDGRDTADRLHCTPLRRLIERGILPPAMQVEARRALAWLDAQRTLPTVFEHGDLGIYNTRMIEADGSDFRVLDWGSSTFDGIALGDLAYLLSSARAPGALGSSCLLRYLQRLELPTEAAAPLWFAYLARRWAELDTVRAPLEGDPGSGGGVLLAIHNQVRPYLDRMAAR